MAVRVDSDGSIRIVTMDRPAARNAVDPAAARALYTAMLAFEADPAADVAILVGAGSAFCAGFDLKAATTPEARAWVAGLDIPEGWDDPVGTPLPSPMGPARLMLSKPVIAAVEGPAVAGGLELACWCDLRVAGAGAVFGVYCRRWGVPLIDGGTVRLPLILGQGRANDLILTGRAVDAREALAIGLADRVAPEGEALAAALALAGDLTRFPQGCLRADHLSARLPGAELAARLRREWRSARIFHEEGMHGAARFAAGRGRGGDFADI